jgi:hypothetical protein
MTSSNLGLLPLLCFILMWQYYISSVIIMYYYKRKYTHLFDQYNWRIDFSKETFFTYIPTNECFVIRNGKILLEVVHTNPTWSCKTYVVWTMFDKMIPFTHYILKKFLLNLCKTRKRIINNDELKMYN